MRYKKSVFRSLAMVTQLGLCVITPVLLCVFIGYQIDVLLGTRWVMVPMLVLGVLSGGRCAWMMVTRVTEAERREDESIRRERETSGCRAGISQPKQPSRIRETGIPDSREGKERWNG